MIRRFARPYARAILDFTKTPQKANEVRAELVRFEAARGAASDLRELFANPGVALDAKLRITEQIAQRLGLSEMSRKVLEVLIRNHRINDLAGVIHALESMINEQLDVVIAEVRTAHRLTDAEKADLTKTLETRMGKRVDVQTIVDPTLLGGFVAKIGSEIWDASVAGKINKFRASLT